jgi:hypothetical protein
MAETTEAQKTAPASGASTTPNEANSNAGSDPSQTSSAATVDSGSDAGKSTASDEADGAADGGERQRPGRAERKISELTKREKELETQLEEKNSLLERLIKTPVDQNNIEFPDYSGVEQITQDQLKKDVLGTATQVVDARMNLLGSALLDRIDQKEVSTKSTEAIQSTILKYDFLNPAHEDVYDEELDKDLSAAYAEARKNNPSYSFTTFIKPYERIWDKSSTTEKSTSTTESSSRGRSAARPSTATRRSANEFPADGTAAQMEEWFAKNRG